MKKFEINLCNIGSQKVSQTVICHTTTLTGAISRAEQKCHKHKGCKFTELINYDGNVYALTTGSKNVGIVTITEIKTKKESATCQQPPKH